MNGASLTTDSPPLWMRIVFGRHPKRTLLRLTCLVVLSVVLFRFIFIPIRVSGFSMLPTYRDGKVTLINHQAYRWSKPRRGDIVAVRLPEESNAVLLKRIVGLPGERVRVIDGKAYINGQLLPEPYAKAGKDARTMPRDWALGDDEYFVVGDNRNISVFVRISEHNLLGKVLF